MPSEMLFSARAMNAARSFASSVTSFCLASSRTDSTMAFVNCVRSFPADSGLITRLKAMLQLGYQVRDYTRQSKLVLREPVGEYGSSGNFSRRPDVYGVQAITRMWPGEMGQKQPMFIHNHNKAK